MCKVRTCKTRVPEMGDKFASRHGQKGTIGHIINEEDMPFTKDGIRPDLIINPHAIPSRMTIAQLKETQLGKLLLELGLYGDGTSFGNLDVKTICKQLQKHNYESKGNELLYDGLTGQQLNVNIFSSLKSSEHMGHSIFNINLFFYSKLLLSILLNNIIINYLNIIIHKLMV